MFQGVVRQRVFDFRTLGEQIQLGVGPVNDPLYLVGDGGGQGGGLALFQGLLFVAALVDKQAADA